MNLPTLFSIEAAASIVYREFQATPQYRWALLSERLGTDCWVKHENHTPVGAFKLRGGLTYFEQLRQTGMPTSVISATRGNHGQSIGWAARSHGVPCRIVVPHGNSVEKNAAMAKAEIAIPGWRIFTDYFLLLKYEGAWKIVQKSYTWREWPMSEKKK